MDPKRTIDLVTTGLVHPGLCAQLCARAALRAAVRTTPTGRSRWSVRHRYGVSAIVAACKAKPPMIALYVHRRAPDARAVSALRDYVAGGGRVLGLHSATASFKGDPDYRRLFGAYFRGHRRVEPTTLHREKSVPAAGRHLPPEFALTDEAYEHEFVTPVDVWYRWAGGEPAIWTTTVGHGRVAYAAPGHRAAVWRSDGLRSVLSALLEWLADGEEVS